ncbi:menaquinone biosynthesis protein [Evansella sp. AB-P1]|uniref:menaquinone biosynthesis protein n=1 Tax=Evansella sp. AB-P1 TaxID=3037653 RepID=UPI00241EAD66|nr:menaquinone biosynthesis protein [Evansella sp. AB-P1]MDG5787600.1 menaquinone biosynthesis protein [Evansella sp. AB-P1]
MSLVIGEISYTNILPFFYYLDRESLISRGCGFVPKVPSDLNNGIVHGNIQVGGISSFSYGEHSDDLVIFPNFSVSSPKEVGSIFLFSKVPITQLHKKSIALTTSSATSINLLRIILKEYFHFDVNYEMMKPNYSKMMAEHDACLLIGDDAITTSWSKESTIHQYDLGALWEYYTGYPMTYAVFAIRKDACEMEPVLLEYLYYEFKKSKEKSIENNFQEMIQSIMQQFGGKKNFWNQYFSGLNYDLTARHIKGLKEYFHLAYKMELLPKKVEKIEIWQPTRHCHSV